jgi:hypothetical protein
MSRTLTIQIEDGTFSRLESEAGVKGDDPSSIAASAIEERFGKRRSTAPSDAQKRFEAHFGSVDLGYPTGADNESIDRDLARE